MTEHPVAGVGRYAEEVGRRLRDLPRAERDAVEADLVSHVREAGCVTYRQCVELFGEPDRYAVGLRDGMGLAPYRPRRRGLVVLGIAVLVGLTTIVAWRALRSDPPDDELAVSGPLMSVVEGTAGDTYGNGIQLVIDDGGDARYAMVLRNVSDRAIDVTQLAPPYTQWHPDGTTMIGGAQPPTGQRKPGAVLLTDLWAPEVHIARLDDPQTISIPAHDRTGEPFTPFRWEPGDAYVVSFAGAVAPCSGDLRWLDGMQTALSIDYTVGDHGTGAAIGIVGIDTEACTS